MKMRTKTIALCLFGLLTAATPAWGADTAVNAHVGFGDGDTNTYTISAKQSYEPWYSSEFGELTPTAELGGTYWDSKDDSLFGAYLAPGLNLTMFTTSSFQPYLAGSVGGIVLSDNDFDNRDLGSNVLFRSTGAVGVKFGDSLQHRVQGDYTHHSTWGLTSTNDGFDAYGVSYGYCF